MKLLVLLLLFPFSLFAQWQAQNSNTDASFRAVSAVSNKVVWIGGTKGTFVRTTNGGETWEAGVVPGAENCDFRDVYAFSAKVAFLMAAGPAEEDQARLYRTGNGGKTWELVYRTKQKGVFFDSIDFWNRWDGLVFSDPIDGKWFVLQTTNGGRNWKQVSPSKLPPLQKGEAAFAASGTSLITRGYKWRYNNYQKAWIASGGAGKGRVFSSQTHTENWKVTETPIPAGPTSGIFGLWFDPQGQIGIAVGGDYKDEKAASQNVAVTTDGGQTWTAGTPTNPPGLKEGIDRLSGKKLVAVGPSGTCYTEDYGKTWTKIDDSAFHSISCSGGRCWAVGAKGKVAVLSK
ncbi:WD40/YVTN/BNR-like repeat-containing protein [Tellurirhabdus bombi]|uniref:WD40/YVTN/BNR-like repeat-containing protein n=1 Tax=Tellurirhabdus bombi TaxID=2907205 RepID=UPI001F19F4D1|nr:oxidoreductase [Tellurirhabdus bombi]